jgi:hypothetical protein
VRGGLIYSGLQQDGIISAGWVHEQFAWYGGREHAAAIAGV